MSYEDRVRELLNDIELDPDTKFISAVDLLEEQQDSGLSSHAKLCIWVVVLGAIISALIFDDFLEDTSLMGLVFNLVMCLLVGFLPAFFVWFSVHEEPQRKLKNQQKEIMSLFSRSRAIPVGHPDHPAHK